MDSKNILIVEDERNLARTLAQSLHLGSDGRFLVETVESGGEALTKMEQTEFDLVISDLRLPGITGLELITQINKFHKETKTILMTGFGSNEIETQAKDQTNGYLTKPFDMLDLLLLVQNVIETSKDDQNSPVDMDSLRTAVKNYRILIMEDDAGLRRIYTKALSKARYDVHEAASIQEARKKLTDNVYDVFICDIHMGRERGTDLIGEFSAKLAEQGTQIVMVSAYGQYRTLTNEMGADFFLEKPISLGTLLTLMGRLVSADNGDGDKNGAKEDTGPLKQKESIN